MLLFAGPLAGSTAASDEMQSVHSHHRRAPVVSGPVVAPVISDQEVIVPPVCHHRHCGAKACRRSVEPPRSPARNHVGVPFGASNRAIFGAQVANGHAAQMVLYQYDFLAGKAALAPAGLRKLAKLTPLLIQSPFPLIIEPARSAPGLDAARRRNVIESLAGLPVPPERVIVAAPPVRGISGAEAQGLNARFMELMIGAGASAKAGDYTAPLP